ncbi:hypothetical protein HED55_04100 [Ochrobactrum haematophilum]|uniref:Uncharacterized protein n=1 Tax=Brucella haematophila TaxID=419474 RepID=A0ABX1DIU0_9HYPH|nr:hypothetical protein [Brucella haematophila]
MNGEKYSFSVCYAGFFNCFGSGRFRSGKTAPGLPGVEAQKPLVSAPPPAPEPDQAPKGNWKNFRVGNTDVSVSGDIIIDVGTGQGGSRHR